MKENVVTLAAQQKLSMNSSGYNNSRPISNFVVTIYRNIEIFIKLTDNDEFKEIKLSESVKIFTLLQFEGVIDIFIYLGFKVDSENQKLILEIKPSKKTIKLVKDVLKRYVSKESFQLRNTALPGYQTYFSSTSDGFKVKFN